MSIRIQVWDEVIPGQRFSAEAIIVQQAETTTRELIRSRVQQEIERHSESLPEKFWGLVQPEESEQILNGFQIRKNRSLDWKVQFERACSSFERNGFLVLVDGRQVSDLDERIELRADSEVQFVKLVPLVGG